VLRWAVELGQIDIATEVSIEVVIAHGVTPKETLARMLYVFALFAYLKKMARHWTTYLDGVIGKLTKN
jgi:hypothetical protein